jgi:serine/threonine protein kinase
MKSHLGEEYDNHGNWKREVKALIVFNKLNDEHIVRGIGAFTQRGKRFILMEYAQCGDLWKVWAKNRDPHLKLTEDRVEQFLEQFRGLANALNRMHDYKVVSLGATAGQVITKEQEIEAENSIESNQSDDADEPLRFQFQLSEFGDTEPKPKALETSTHENGGPESQEPATQGQQPHERKVHFQEPEHEAMTNTPTNPKATENWRHGDLKPDNILSFGEDGSSWLGTLKLADLGRARQHMDRTANRQGTNENFSTVPYDPPEVWTSLNEKGRSRLVDIWSFGCVLLESVIWLLFGFEELMRFRHRPTGFGSLYWTDESIHNKTAKLNDSTFEWINQLLKYDPEFMDSKKGSAMRDVILLIKNKLLLIKLPADYDVLEKDCRINSKGLVDELDEILRKGRQDPSYFFSGRDRAEIEAPQIAQTRPKEQKSDQFLSADVRLSSRNVIQNPTPAPWPARPESGYGERIDSYLHDFDDKWDYVEDNSFACRVANRLKIDVKQLLEQKTSILCDSCVSLNWKADTLEIKDSLAELRRRKVEERCELCAMMLRIAEKTPNMDWVEFDKSGSGLRINRSAGLPVLTIRQISGE